MYALNCEQSHSPCAVNSMLLCQRHHITLSTILLNTHPRCCAVDILLVILSRDLSMAATEATVKAIAIERVIINFSC